MFVFDRKRQSAYAHSIILRLYDSRSLFLALLCVFLKVRAQLRRKDVLGTQPKQRLIDQVSEIFSFQRKKKSLFDQVRLLSPTEVDTMARSRGLDECDPVTLLSTISMACPMTLIEAKALSPPQPRVKTWDASGAEGSRPNELQNTLCYMRNFLCKPHACSGRVGTVCPFMPKSLQIGGAKLGLVRTSSIPKDDLLTNVTQLLLDLGSRFQSMPLTSKKDRQYKTIVLVFPDIELDDCKHIIEGAQLAAKPEIVSRGLMVGEFHAMNNVAGNRNGDFYPLRTPHPLLVIRHMVPNDYVFMTHGQEDYPVEMQRRFLSSFLDVFGEEDIQQTKDARERLQRLG